jgi:RND family efflux transporter MFP subunit
MDRLMCKVAICACLALAGPVGLAPLSIFAPVHAQEPETLVVGVDEVREEPLSQTVAVVGQMVAKRSSRVAAQVAGAVKTVHVQVGDNVTAGDVIAELDSDSKLAERGVLQAQIATAEAELEAARIQLTLTMQELTRQSRLEKSGAFSKSRFETAQQEVLKAQAQIERNRAVIATHQASVHMTQLEIDRATITAPFDGIVVERLTDSGNYLRVGDPVIRLLSDSQLEIEAEVPSLRIAGLKPGYRVAASLEDGTEFSALVRAVLPIENPLTRTRPVRFVPNWPDNVARLADAQSVTVYVPVGPPRDVVTVHKDAIVRQAGRALVYVVNDGTAAPRTVQLGEATGSRFEVVAGLKVGDVTVIRGNERLLPGAKVRVKTGS